MYPCIKIKSERILNNVKTVKSLCKNYGLNISAVSKVFCGDPKIAKIHTEAGIKIISDSRIENLMRMSEIDAEKWLIRPPQLHEIDSLVDYADTSLNSELSTIHKIAEVARKKCKKHKIILMADLGDIREGFCDYTELVEVAKIVESIDSLHLYGVATNLACFSFVQPSKDKMDLLLQIASRIEEEIRRPLEIVSGGNSSTINLMLSGAIPKGVNNLRLGESLLFGRERASYTYLNGTSDDVFILECQIIELKDKPSLPWGEIGVDSYGSSPVFENLGIRKKAICAVGKQDFDLETSSPIDEGIKLLGASSDHLMIDITDSKNSYKVGDIIELKLGYFSTMRAFTSEYVKKIYE